MAEVKGIMLYFDIKEPLKEFSDEERGKLLWALLEYGETLTMPQFSGSLKTAFNFIKKDIDRDREKYIKKCEQNRDNKIKGLSKDNNDCQQSITTDNDGQQSILNKINSTNHKIKEDNNSLFVQFWSAYPKKKDKKSAEKAFKKIAPDEALLQTMLNAIEEQKKSAEWQKDNGQFIPHPATWLNGHRWEDEIQVTTCQKEPSFDVDRAEIQAKNNRADFGTKKNKRRNANKV